jgi:D-3-phosphoglycerate dehydrogenase
MSDNLLRGEVVVTWPVFDLDGPDTGAALTRAGLTVRLAPKIGHRSPADLGDVLGDAVAVIASTDPFSAELFRAKPHLRVIARTGVGVDAIDVDAATDAGVLVITTPGAHEETVADHTLALLLALVRRLPEHDQSMRSGHWDRAGTLTPGDLFEATVGLVGSGAIGRAVIRRLRGFGCTILVADPALDSPQEGTELVELDELLQRSDAVSLHLPLLPQTRGMLGAAEFALMKPSAVLINASRGHIVDEVALASALRGGQIAAAGFDVFAAEPPTGSELLDLPNVLLTPHVGGLSHRSIAELTRRATAGVVEALRGGVPIGTVNPEARTRAADQ